MTTTVALDAYPRQIMSGQTFRGVDKTVCSGEVECLWAWVVREDKVWTASAAPSTQVNLATASTLFAVGEQVIVFSSTADLPLGLLSPATVYYVKTATSTYLELSLTSGGAAVQYTDAGTGTFYICHASSYKNGTIKPCAVTTTTDLTVDLYVVDSGPSTHSASSTGLIRIYPAATAVAKPTSSSIFSRLSIFVYDSTNATAINRMKTTNNNLYFQDLKVTGSMNKAGQVTFKVYNSGGATATEKGLMVADKNVAIISGRNVIWSGKILRATQGKMSLFDTASPFMSWTVECESDISKMKKQNVKAANQIVYSAPPGYIVSKLVENDAATDIDWRGVIESSFIGWEGSNINYTITNADMFEQFFTIATITGYDWRTRNNYVKYQYGASGYSSVAKTVTLSAITPYTTNSFAGRWLLFVNSTNVDTTANIVGIRAYGNIASNTTTVITLTSITNDTIPPASSEYVIILGDPVLDFASDLRQPNYQATFTANKARAAALQNAYEMNDKSDFKNIATKVISKGKTSYPSFSSIYNGTANSGTQTAMIVGKDAWDPAKGFFKNSMYITQKTQGYVHSYDSVNEYIYIIGQGYALRLYDTCTVYWSVLGADYYSTSFGIDEIVEMSMSDGIPVTRVHCVISPGAAIPKYAIFADDAIFISDSSIVTQASPGVTVNIGTGVADLVYVGGTDTIRGPYILIYSLTTHNYVCPHLPGCIISLQTYTEASPQTNSPINIFGLMTKTAISDQNVSVSDLEVYATNLLVNNSVYYRKGGFWCFVYDWFKTDLRPTNQVTEAGWIVEGGLIAVLQNTADTATDLEYNQYKNQWQVLSWSLDANQMIVTVELGDFERNTNTLINDKTTGINYTIT